MVTPTDRAKRELENLEAVAGNGLLHRRELLRGGAALAGAMTGYTLVQSASDQQLADDAWSLVLGATVPDYGVRSRFEKNVVRTLSNPKSEPRTPHHLLNRTFTPNGLHFVISHAGDPDIDPDKHRLVIHGLVSSPWSLRWMRWRVIQWRRESLSSSAAETARRYFH
jgi:sulfane dehydrogenase subunit SoxC